jgi:FixJ family two-component response regulator
LRVSHFLAGNKTGNSLAAMAAGAVAMLRKPVTEGILLQAFRSAMSLKTLHECEKNLHPQPV